MYCSINQKPKDAKQQKQLTIEKLQQAFGVIHDFSTNYHADQYANLYGRIQGKNNPNDDCRNLVEKYRPNGLGGQY